MKKIGVFVGSLRKDSYNKKVGQTILKLFPENYNVSIIPIGDLPLYNEDIDVPGKEPESYSAFRKEVEAIDGAVFVTPEYNRGLPAVLKNALDVGSRPPAEGKWNKLPAAIITVSPGRLGGFGANHQLRQTLCFLNMPVVAQPEMYLSEIHTMFDENHEPTEVLLKLLHPLIDRFIDLIKISPRP